METVRSVIEISGTLYFSIPKKWSRKKGLKKGDKMLVIANDKILAEGIKVIKTEEEAHEKVLEYEKQLEAEMKAEEPLTSREKGKMVSEALKERLP